MLSIKSHTINLNYLKGYGMRKLIIVSVIGLLIAGCGKDKITNDWFIGDWRCSSSKYERVKSGESEDYGEVKNTIDRIVTYKIIEGELFSIISDNKPQKINLPSKEGKTIVSEQGNDIVTFKQSFTFNDNSYETITKIDVKNKKNNTDIIDLRQMTKTICTRIK